MDFRSLSERDVCTKFITPAIVGAGWDLHTQFREEVTLTVGRVVVRGKLARRNEKTIKRADYVLYRQPGVPLAVVEAKEPRESIGAGMPQALAYAEALDVPFAFSSNGDGFVFHDRTGHADPVERNIALREFPVPAELWSRYRRWKGLSPEAEKIVTAPYHDDGSGKSLRYFQQVAANRTVEAVAKGQRRVLLVMATGTGKTYTAFQIIWRLRQAGIAKRTLFLADRNVLVDQTMTNDFKPFGAVMTKVKDRTIDKAYEVYMALYQAVSGTEEERNIYRQFSADFFDLVVVDECHRGSARENSAWREILEYFEPAVHLGLTATPKETCDVSNIAYFGDPVYTYSLRQGIEDGFLAPYKVVRVDLDRDLLGWRPEKGMLDDRGQVIDDRVFNQRDMDNDLILTERTKLVAAKIMEYLLATDPYAKTIVFCEGVDHASRMRQELTNEVARRLPEEIGNRRYVMQITGDNTEGKAELDNFIHPEERYPVIATTSKLLSTGVDAQTCRLIVLDQRVESMTEFKQMIGRGTRIREDVGKLWFTILDFKKATELFADPDFDGDPVQIYEPGPGDPPVPSDDDADGEDRHGDVDNGERSAGEGSDDGATPRRRFVVSGVAVTVLAERVQYIGGDGKLVTESLRDFTRRAVREKYSSLDAFLRHWSDADRKRAVLDELTEQGVFVEDLVDPARPATDPLDVVCHVAFDRPPLTRRERAENVRKRDVFARYGPQARAVLDALLVKYAEEGIESVEDMKVLGVPPISSLGTPVELVHSFGGKEKYLDAVRLLERELYRSAG